MSALAPRVLFRHHHVVLRQTTLRQASTTSKATDAASNTAAKVKESASETTSKATQGLSRVTSSAGSAMTGVAQGVGNTLGRIGGRTGRLFKFVESMIPPTVYYSKVGLELSKLVFQGQKMSPPNIATFQSYLQPALNVARTPSSLQHALSTGSLSPESILNRIRNVSQADMIFLGVIGAELLGFFTIGEMIGRFKLVGYRGDTVHHETATPH